jgi:hypothetical protein
MLKISRTLLSAFLAASSAPLAAQVVSIGPSIGYYRPFGRFDPASLFSTALPRQPSDLAGMAWGVEVSLRLRRRIGAEAIFSTVTSTVPGCLCPGGPRPPTGERVTLLVLAGQYRIDLPRRAYDLRLSAGPATIQHGGDGYGYYGSPRSWGGAGALELTRRMGSHVEAVARAMGLAYSLHHQALPQSGGQFDGLISLAARWRFGAALPGER